MLAYKKLFDDVFEEVGKVIVGQQEMVTQILSAILADGNALVEGYPGLAKTLTVRTLARIMDLRFSRIQNTPDLMPSDITGTYVLEESNGKREFKFHPGPVFANVVLADEINRATPKTQSALLEAMQEKQVTVGNTTYKLDLPFFVLATMNPIEQEGTYPLPEAQADRFLLKIKVTYPSFDEEMEIVNRYTAEDRERKLRVVVSKEQLLDLQALTRQVPVSSDIKQFIVKLVNETRNRKDIIEYGASPRASTGLVLASKARALISGRNHVSIEDVRAMAYPVLRHRIILNFEAERKGLTADGAVKLLLDKVK
ncbi:MoxR family ATPase [Candidatus Woesearchaeota archaeon]|nr:MoxR family ATPase [Candidatus Woesearchaeota archaeon]MBI2550164.1 MoxR family ATPase [Candidatus Woesearchaeota archaeon]